MTIRTEIVKCPKCDNDLILKDGTYGFTGLCDNCGYLQQAVAILNKRKVPNAQPNRQ